MAVGSVYLSDAAEQLFAAEATRTQSSRGKLLARLGLAAICGVAPESTPLPARLLAALRDGPRETATIAEFAGCSVEEARSMLGILATVIDDDTDKPIVKLDDHSGRALWSLVSL